MSMRSVMWTAAGLVWLAACSAEPEQPAADQSAAAGTPVADGSLPSGPQPTASTEASDAAERPSLAVEGAGLRWFLPTGSARPMPFGMARADVLAPLERFRGPAETGTQDECGAGPVAYASWPDGLTVLFQEDRFVGWSLGRDAAGKLSTANGVGPGMTRKELAGSFGTLEFLQSTLGTEFMAGDISGVLDGEGAEARITDMWAGVSCVAR